MKKLQKNLLEFLPGTYVYIQAKTITKKKEKGNPVFYLY